MTSCSLRFPMTSPSSHIKDELPVGQPRLGTKDVRAQEHIVPRLLHFAQDVQARTTVPSPAGGLNPVRLCEVQTLFVCSRDSQVEAVAESL